jgi:hypothetical protein
VPFLKRLHALHAEGKPMDLPVSPEEYARRRARYRSEGTRKVSDGEDGDERGCVNGASDPTAG